MAKRKMAKRKMVKRKITKPKIAKRRIKEQVVGDQTLRVVEVGFKSLKEDWNEYELDDGTSVRMKTIVGKIFYVVDDKDKNVMLPDGDPFLLVRSQNQVVATTREGD